jgi:peptidyl-dipeptidase Dcp
MNIVPSVRFIVDVINKQQLKDSGYSLQVRENDMDVFQEDENSRSASMSSLVTSLEKPEEFLIAASILGYDLSDDTIKEIEKLGLDRKEAAAQIAEEKGQAGKWAFTLDYPSYIPAMTYAKNRELRQKLYLAYNTKSAKGDELDNQEIIKNILKFRHDRANLLGYPSHASFVLEERMAQSPQNVMEFLESLLQKAKPKAAEDVREVADFAKTLDGLDHLERWDFAYYSELLKKEKYALDDELLRPYFQLEQVIDGVFQTAGRLFGIRK